MRHRCLRYVVLGAGLLLPALWPAAPDAAAPPFAEDQRVSLVVFGGVNLGTPGQDFVDAMHAATLADDYFPLGGGGGAGRSRPTPELEEAHWAYGVALGYVLSPEWEVLGLARGEEDVSAFGVHQPDEPYPYRVQLAIDASSTRYAALVAYRPLGWVLRVGLGPALTSAEVWARDDWTEFPSDSDTRFGFLAEGAITWPLRQRGFAEVAARYWYAGEMTYGPYSLPNSKGTVQVYFPSQEYSLDRTDVTLGAGIRF
jgi:hypothetical protein